METPFSPHGGPGGDPPDQRVGKPRPHEESRVIVHMIMDFFFELCSMSMFYKAPIHKHYVIALILMFLPEHLKDPSKMLGLSKHIKSWLKGKLRPEDIPPVGPGKELAAARQAFPNPPVDIYNKTKTKGFIYGIVAKYVCASHFSSFLHVLFHF